MPITSAARRASLASSSVQQPRAPVRYEDGFDDNARWTPVTSCPASTARAAAVAESTPPDIAASTLNPLTPKPYPPPSTPPAGAALAGARGACLRTRWPTGYRPRRLPANSVAHRVPHAVPRGPPTPKPRGWRGERGERGE